MSYPIKKAYRPIMSVTIDVHEKPRSAFSGILERTGGDVNTI